MLAVTDIHLSIQGAHILNGIDFNVTEGETVGIIGPNGSGKTSLFNCISGFNRVQTGSIRFRGRDVTFLPPFKRATLGLGRTFQNFGVFREMTLLENVVTALEGHQHWWQSFLPWGSASKENRRLAAEYLDTVGLGPKAGHKAGSLSGGQMRLLEIIRTLAFGAELMLLDEPTAGVSPKMKEDVVALIHKLQVLNKTVVVIEHDINFIQKFCSRIVVLNEGLVVLDDTPERVRANALLQQIYFGKGINVEDGKS